MQRNLGTKNKVEPSSVSANQNSFFHEGLKQKELEGFWRAIVEDRCNAAKDILKNHPNVEFLLLSKAPKGTIIENQNTWATFNLENEMVLSIAVKRKQIEMIEVLLSYYDKLPQTEEVIQARQEGLSAWKPYEMQKNVKGKEEIVVPFIYRVAAESLIKVFATETFPNGIQDERNRAPVQFSDATESALSILLKRVSPKEAVTVDEYFDPELFLLALYLAYDELFNLFQNWQQRHAFCIRVVGLVQSVLSPETVIFLREHCRSVTHGYNIQTEPQFKFYYEFFRPYYRPARDSLDGLGGMYSLAWQKPGFGRTPYNGLQYFLPRKNIEFTQLCCRDNSNANQLSEVSNWQR